MQRPQTREPDRRSQPPSRSARTRPVAACRRASTQERPANQQLARAIRATHAPTPPHPRHHPNPLNTTAARTLCTTRALTAGPGAHPVDKVGPTTADTTRSTHLVHRPSTRRRPGRSPHAQSRPHPRPTPPAARTLCTARAPAAGPGAHLMHKVGPTPAQHHRSPHLVHHPTRAPTAGPGAHPVHKVGTTAPPYRTRPGGAVVLRTRVASLYRAAPGWRRRIERRGWSPSERSTLRREGCLARVWVGNPAQPGEPLGGRGWLGDLVHVVLARDGRGEVRGGGWAPTMCCASFALLGGDRQLRPGGP
ncbi:hypothetical protein EV648_112144 [Kribbella sp. VKM Ac-2568]|nr:hypothetical protein EV648_112144 [Kribbella sp. VKM Ac-2568]